MPVRSLDILRELIPQFLAGQLDRELMDAFKAGMAEYPELKREVDEISNLKAGLDLFDQTASGHLSADDIIAYSQSRQNLSSDSIAEIEAHLADCNDCREEVELTRLTIPAEAPARQTNVPQSYSFLERVRELLFPQRLVLRPVYAYVAILLLLVPAFFGLREIADNRNGLSILNVSTSNMRGSAVENVVSVGKSTRTVQLEFPAFPAALGHTYNVLLRDQNSLPVMAWYGVSLTADTRLEVSAAMLTAAQYFLVIEDLNHSGAIVDTFPPVLLKIEHLK